jgi:ArsR family transcriptional regulator
VQTKNNGAAVDWDHLSEIFKTLGHPLRLRMVALLSTNEEHVGGLARRAGAAQATVSQHLAILRSHGLVQRRREEGRAIYSLALPGLVDLVRCVKGCQGASADTAVGAIPAASNGRQIS